MSTITIVFNVYRFDPNLDREERYDRYEVTVPDGEKWTVMQGLDEIYENLDPTIGYFRHSACHHGKCYRCTLRLNGKVILACQTYLSEPGKYRLDPVSKKLLVRDLVIFENKVIIP